MITMVLYAVRCTSNTSADLVSPLEEFSGRKLDYSRDLRGAFGDFCHATSPNTNSDVESSGTQAVIFCGDTGNLQGSVTMLQLRTGKLIVRDQFEILPMPNNVVELLNSNIKAEGYTLVGDNSEFVVSTYIDTAYGVHTTSGRSYTGCTITLGRAPVHIKSSKQKIVTKSSTEAELMGLSDICHCPRLHAGSGDIVPRQYIMHGTSE